MLTARKLIERAALKLRVLDQTDGLPGEIYTQCLGVLNTMLRVWSGQLLATDTAGTALYAPFANLAEGETELDDGDAPNLQDYHEEGVIAQLAIRVAPIFNKSPDGVTIVEARTGWGLLWSAYGNPGVTDHAEFTDFNGRQSHVGL